MPAPRRRVPVMAVAALAAVALAACAGGAEEEAGQGVEFTERSAIYLVDRDGEISRLSDEPGESRGLTWAPDGRQLAYVSAAATDTTIRVIDVATGGARTLGASEERADGAVAWSPDGRSVAFVLSGSDREQLVLASPDGLDSRVLATYRGLGSALGLTWTPTSDRIVLARPLPEPSEDGARVSERELALSVDLVVVSPSDGSQVRLTRDAALERDPSWSPRGEAVLFLAEGAAGRDQLSIAGTDASESRPLAPSLAASRFGRWSPDGSHIGFLGSARPRLQTVCMVKPDGTELTELAAADARSPVAWSPDGNELAFSAEGVYTVSASGGPPRRLVELPGVEITDLAWSPDGSALAFVAAVAENDRAGG